MGNGQESNRFRHRTLDSINALIKLEYENETVPSDPMAQVIIKKPSGSVGNVLTQSKLGAPEMIDSDNISARYTILMQLEKVDMPLSVFVRRQN